MAQWGLVADLCSSGVRLCAVSSASVAAAPHCITDGVGRDVFLLDSPSLWPEDAAAAFTIRERVRWLTALVADEDPPRSLDLDAANRKTMELLTEGLTQFAETRLQRTIKAVAVLLPAPVSSLYQDLFPGYDSPLVLSHALAALYAYELSEKYVNRDDFGYAVITDVGETYETATIAKVDDGYYQTLQSSRRSVRDGVHTTVPSVVHAVCRQQNVTLTDLNDVILMGDIDGAMLNKLTETVNALMPQATLYTSIPPTEVAIRGGAVMMRHFLKRPVATCSLTPSLVTIRVKVLKSVTWPLASRSVALPTAKRSRLRVYVPLPSSGFGVPDAAAGPLLQFFEGERESAHDNNLLGSIQMLLLAPGWHDIDVEVHLDSDHVLSVRASLVLADNRCSRAIKINVPSSVTGMKTMEELAAYSTSQDDLVFPTGRDALIEQLGLEDWIRTAHELAQREAPSVLVHAGDILPKIHRTTVCLSDRTAGRLAALLNGVNWSQHGGFNASSVRTAAVELIGETAVSEVDGWWPCAA